MKKLALFFAAVLMTAISSNVFGQDTGSTPSLGSTHDYRITPHAGSSYSWSVDKGAIGISAGSDVTLVNADTEEVSITWNAIAEPGVNYYVRILETDATLCTNEKALLVVPANLFYLSVATSVTPVCYPDPVVITTDISDEPLYNHGTVDLVYTVTPNELGSATGYGFDFSNILDIADDANFSVTDTTVSAGAAIVGVGSDSIYMSATTPVVITFQITNDVLFNNTSDADGTGATISMPTTISDGKTSQNVPDNGTGDTYTATSNATRPATTAITFD